VMDYFVQALIELYKSHGESLLESPSLAKEELSTRQNIEKSKIYAIASAIEEKIPVTLRDSNPLTDEDLDLIIRGFAESTGIKEELAKWAITTLYEFVKLIAEDSALRHLKRKSHARNGTYTEVKEGLVKITLLRGEDKLTLFYDGSTPFVDFIEPYIEDWQEIMLELSGNIDVERPITIQSRKIVLVGLEKCIVNAEVLPAFEVIKGELLIENLTLKYSKDPDRTIGVIFATESSVEVRNTEIYGAGIKVYSSKLGLSKVKVSECKYIGIHGENAEIKIVGSVFEGNGIDIFSPQVRVKDCVVNIKNSKVMNGNGSGIWGDNCEILLDKSTVSGNYYYGIFIDSSSKLTMTSSRIVENGNSEEDYPQLKVVTSNAKIKAGRILNGVNNSGIWLEDTAFLEADDLKVTGHYFHGIVLRDDSEILMRGGELARNGNEEEDKPQMLVESSRGYVKGVKIHGGVYNSGVILDEGSKLELVDSHIYRHFFNALTVRSSSDGFLTNCEIHENGNEYFYAPQIWVSSGNIRVEKSSIYDGVKNDGIYVRNSSVELDDVSIYNHVRRAIYGEANSTIKATNSRVYLNNKNADGEAQIEVKSCNLIVKNSDIEDSYSAAGIYAGDIANVELQGVRIRANYGQGVWFSSNASFTIIDCLIEENRGKDGMFPQVLVTSSRGRVERSKILKGQRVSGIVVEKSFLEMMESIVEGNENFGIYVLSNSVAEILSCEIKGNGQDTKEYPQIRVENSKIILKSSQISSGIGNSGLSIMESSYAEIENAIISNHARHGIEVYYNSELRFNEGEISGNGAESENFAQVWIGSSYALIKNSVIHDGKNNMGIGILKSYVEIESCRIFGHKEEGVSAAWYSGLKIKDCKIYSNTMSQSSAQLVITSSRCIARGCEIYNSLGGDGIRMDDGAGIELENAKVIGNMGYGMTVKNGSESKLQGTEFIRNCELQKHGYQIIIDSSRGIFKNCKVAEGVSGGIKILNSPTVEVYHSVISDHSGPGIEIVDNLSRIKIVGVRTFGNAMGGLVYHNPYKVSTIDSTFEDGSFRKN